MLSTFPNLTAPWIYRNFEDLLINEHLPCRSAREVQLHLMARWISPKFFIILRLFLDHLKPYWPLIPCLYLFCSHVGSWDHDHHGNHGIMIILESWLDCNFDMLSHVNNICSSSFYYIYSIRRSRKYLSHQTAISLYHSFKLDYCNSLLYGLP